MYLWVHRCVCAHAYACMRAFYCLRPETKAPPFSHPNHQQILHNNTQTGLRALLLLSTAVLIGVAVGLGTARLFVRLNPPLRADPLRQVGGWIGG